MRFFPQADYGRFFGGRSAPANVNLTTHAVIATGAVGSGSQQPNLTVSFTAGQLTFSINDRAGQTLTVDTVPIPSLSLAVPGEWYTGGSYNPADFEIRLTISNQVENNNFITGPLNVGSWVPPGNYVAFWFISTPGGTYTADWLFEIRDAATLTVLGSATMSIASNE